MRIEFRVTRVGNHLRVLCFVLQLLVLSCHLLLFTSRSVYIKNGVVEDHLKLALVILKSKTIDHNHSKTALETKNDLVI